VPFIIAAFAALSANDCCFAMSYGSLLIMIMENTNISVHPDDISAALHSSRQDLRGAIQ
jgi:hypothetical protein